MGKVSTQSVCGTTASTVLLFRLSAIGRHDIDIEISVVLGGEGDPLAVGRKFWKELAARMGSDLASHATIARRQPEIAAVHECDFVLVDVGETHQPAFLHFLP